MITVKGASNGILVVSEDLSGAEYEAFKSTAETISGILSLKKVLKTL